MPEMNATVECVHCNREAPAVLTSQTVRGEVKVVGYKSYYYCSRCNGDICAACNRKDESKKLGCLRRVGKL